MWDCQSHYDALYEYWCIIGKKLFYICSQFDCNISEVICCLLRLIKTERMRRPIYDDNLWMCYLI